MSQHVFRTVDRDCNAVRATLGYDRPLDFVFCFVDDGREKTIYTNLDDDDAGIHQQDVNYYRQVLARLGIDVPEEMFREVQSDQRNAVGNRFVDHTR